MNAYEELVERCVNAQVFLGQPGYDPAEDNMRAVLAEVLRTLETVTPDVPEPSTEAIDMGGLWISMLRASPLAPPAGAP